jgi:hypothetical protein
VSGPCEVKSARQPRWRGANLQLFGVAQGDDKISRHLQFLRIDDRQPADYDAPFAPAKPRIRIVDGSACHFGR